MAWNKHKMELKKYLHGQLGNSQLAEDILQDIFVKALVNSQQFCQLENPRAWLYRVAKNAIIDLRRTHKKHDEVDEDYSFSLDEKAPVVNLSKCLPNALKNLSNEDKEIIQRCDLDGLNQNEYAQFKNISITNAKSRIKRARKRLKLELQNSCKIVFDKQDQVCCFEPKCQ